MRLLSSLLVALLWVTAAGAATYYASPSASGGGDGSVGDPWTKDEACDNPSSGDIVLLRGGDYDTTINYGSGDYLWTWQPNTTGITYKAYPGEVPILRGGDSITHNLFYPTNGTVLDSLTFRGGGTYTIHASGYNVVIKNCSFDSTPVPECPEGNNCGVMASNNDATYMRGWKIFDNYFGPNCDGRGCVHPYGADSTEVYNNTFDRPSVSYGNVVLKTGGSGNRNNRIHDNIFYMNSSIGINIHCDATVGPVYVYSNLFYGGGPQEWVRMSYWGCIDDGDNFDSIFVYNNTFDCANMTSGDIAIANWGGYDGVNEFMDNFFIFNNIFYLPYAAEAVHAGNRNNSGTTVGFGDYWYSDYNMFVQRSYGQDIYTWGADNGTVYNYNLGEWRTAGPAENATYTSDPNSDTTSDTTDMFINRGTADYRLDPDGSQYTFLSTGGRGGAWPTYIGAFDPDVVVGCNLTRTPTSFSWTDTLGLADPDTHQAISDAA